MALKPEVKAVVKPKTKAEYRQPASDANAPKADVEADEQAHNVNPKTRPEVTPQLIKRVHEL